MIEGGMKREIERERKTPAFCIDVADLENLLSKMSNLFNNQEKIYQSIDVTLLSEKLSFNDIDELKRYPNLKGKIINFTISMSQDGRRVIIRSGGLLSYRASVTSKGESEAWCAGAGDTVY
jgi:hypothetical protein